MPLDFPSNPTDGQISGNYVWSASSGVWKSKPTVGSATIQSPTVPISANPGDVWVNTSDGTAFSYFDDGTSRQWMEILSSGVPNLASKADLSYTNTQLALKSNLSGASFTGTINGSYGGTGVRFNASNTTAGTDQYTNALNVSNDTGYKVIHFLNSSTRSIDGGANAYTIRNDGGPLNLGSSSYNTNLSGYVTMPNQPTYYGGISGYGATTSNYFPTLVEGFNIGFSRSGNNRLTAQVAGKYYVAAQQLVNTTGTTAYYHIMKNGSSIAYAYSNGDDTYDMNVSALVSLQVNDYIELYVTPTTTYSWPSPHSSYSVFKVS